MKIDSFRLFIIIIISLVILAFIIIGIVLLIKWYKRPGKKEENNIVESSNNEISPGSIVQTVQRANITNIQNTNIFNIHNHIPLKTRSSSEYLTKEKKIDAFCDVFLKPINYSLVKIFNESCPIDLVRFAPDDNISVTKCKHGFHFDCIKKYLLENENNKEIKCPICLNIILEIKTKLI